MNGSGYRHTLEPRHAGVVGVAAGLGQPSPSSIASVATAAMLVSANQMRERASTIKEQATRTVGHTQPEQAAKTLEAKSSPYLRQPKIKHIDDAVTPLLVASRLEKVREKGRERELVMGEMGAGRAEVAVMAEVVLQEPGRERLHSEATRGAPAIRSDHAEPQVQTSTSHRDHRIERQLSSEQLIQARRDELPQEVWREHAERRERRTLERQTSSEQEGGHGGLDVRRKERDRHRLERQESSEHDTGHSDRRSAGG